MGLFFVAAAVTYIAGPIAEAAISLAETLVIAALCILGLAVITAITVLVIRAHHRQGLAIRAMHAEPVRAVRAEVIPPTAPAAAIPASEHAAAGLPHFPEHTVGRPSIHLPNLSPEAAEALGRALRGEQAPPKH